MEGVVRSVNKPHVRSKALAKDWEVNDKGRSDILEILEDDVVVMQVLYAGQHGTGDKNNRANPSLLSPDEERSNVPTD